MSFKLRITNAAVSLAAFSVLSAGLTSQSSAAIQHADAASTGNSQETFFDGNILTNDLINQGQATFGGLTATAGASFPASGSDDGTAAHTNGLTYYGASSADLTYTLNTNSGTGGSATGYDISLINSIYGWQDSRLRHAAQHWDLSISTLAVPALTPYLSVDYDPFNDGAAGSTQVTVTDTAGLIASGVTAIQFHLRSDNGTEVGVVREFDVTGTPTAVPEPGSLSLLGLAGVGFLTRRRD